MDFRIADAATDRLAELTGEEHEAVKTSDFDLYLNPANPAMNLHTYARHGEGSESYIPGQFISPCVCLCLMKTAEPMRVIPHEQQPIQRWACRSRGALRVGQRATIIQWPHRETAAVRSRGIMGGRRISSITGKARGYADRVAHMRGLRN